MWEKWIKFIKKEKKNGRREQKEGTLRGADGALAAEHVNLLVVVEKTKIMFSQYKGSTGCCRRELEHTSNFPPFLLCNNLHRHDNGFTQTPSLKPRRSFLLKMEDQAPNLTFSCPPLLVTSEYKTCKSSSFPPITGIL